MLLHNIINKVSGTPSFAADSVHDVQGRGPIRRGRGTDELISAQQLDKTPT